MGVFYSGGSEEKGICGDYTKYVEYVCVLYECTCVKSEGVTTVPYVRTTVGGTSCGAW